MLANLSLLRNKKLPKQAIRSLNPPQIWALKPIATRFAIQTENIQTYSNTFKRI
jgi:hypothetical protein